MKDIIKIEQLKNVWIRNLHNGFTVGMQKILCVTYQDNTTSYIDLIAGKDMTNIDYLKVITDKNTKIQKKIFEEKNRI